MNCHECLEEMSTGSLRELTPDSEVSRHAASCRDCGPLLTQLRDREYTAATVLNNLPPLSNPISVAETAGQLSRRRRIGRVVVTLTAIALGISIWFAADTMIPHFGGAIIGENPALRTETIPLTCLSPQQAAELINPYVRSNHSTYYIAPTGIAAITVRASELELRQVHEVLRNFDTGRNGTCHTNPTMTFGELEKAMQEFNNPEVQKQLRDLTNRPAPAGEKSSPAKSKHP